MPEDAQLAESSTATTEVVEATEVANPELPVADLDLSTLTPAQVREWKQTGNLPEPTKKPAPAASDKAEGDAKAKADTKPPADAAAATKAENQARYKELLADRAQAKAEALQLRQKIAELESRSQVEPEKAKPEPTSKAPELPDESDHETFAAYKKAMAEYYDKLADFKLEQHDANQRERAESEKRATENADIMSGWESRLADAIEAAGDPIAYEKSIGDAADVLKDHPGIARFIMKSPLGPEMAARLGRDPKALRALTRITDGADLADALADLKNDVRQGATKPTASGLPAKPKPVAVSSPPPRELSTSATGTSDRMAALQERIDKGDSAAFGEWKAEMNRVELASRRR